MKGTPYEMGYQQGALLRDDIRESVHYLFEVKGKELKVELGGVNLLKPKRIIQGIAAQQRKHVPERFFEEMQGIANGAGDGRAGHHRGQLHPLGTERPSQPLFLRFTTWLRFGVAWNWPLALSSTPGKELPRP